MTEKRTDKKGIRTIWPGGRGCRAGVLVALIGVVLVGAITVLWWTGCAGRREGIRNVVLITMDTTRADHLGCYNPGGARTPNLDRMAREGTRFARVSACTPLTLPSHCTIMTGTYPWVHGVRKNGPDRLPPASVTLAEMLKQAGFGTHAFVASFVLNRTFGLSQGFDDYKEVPAGEHRGHAVAERRGDAVCDDAIALLRGLGPGRFFLWVHFYDPHYPYESSRALPVDSPEAYAEEITFMDAQIGRLLAEIENLGIGRETLVVAVGDHGEGLGEHGESEHGYFAYETTMQVPLLLRCPGRIPAGGVVNARVGTVDVTPTILDFLGQPLPDFLQGRSLRGLAQSDPTDSDLPVYGEAMAARLLLGLSALRCLYRGRWKYVDSSDPELFDLDIDPGERTNRAGEQAERAAEMRRELLAFLAMSPAEWEAKGDAVALTDVDLDRLRSLGYIASGDDETVSGKVDAHEYGTMGPSPRRYADTIERYSQAQRRMAEGEYAAALDLFREVLEVLPDAPYPLRDVQSALEKLGRGDEIFGVCEEILARHPEAVNTRVRYARWLEREGWLDKSADQLAMAIETDPERMDARHELADVLLDLGRFQEARVQHQAVLSRDPEDTRALRGLGIVCYREGNLEKAKEWLRKAIAIDPDDGEARAALQQVLASENRRG